MKISRVIKGIVIYGEDKLLGRVFITDENGVKQMHSENYGISPIRMFRIYKEFLKDQTNIVSACHCKNEQLYRGLKLLGFYLIGQQIEHFFFKKD